MSVTWYGLPRRHVILLNSDDLKKWRNPKRRLQKAGKGARADGRQRWRDGFCFRFGDGAVLVYR